MHCTTACASVACAWGRRISVAAYLVSELVEESFKVGEVEALDDDLLSGATAPVPTEDDPLALAIVCDRADPRLTLGIGGDAEERE